MISQEPQLYLGREVVQTAKYLCNMPETTQMGYDEKLKIGVKIDIRFGVLSGGSYCMWADYADC